MRARVLVTGGGTGGHLYPALNLMEALRASGAGVELLYVGAERGLEARVAPERGIPHRLLPMEPFDRQRPARNWKLLAAAPAVTAGVRRIFAEFEPDLVVGTGGYASAPCVLGAKFTGRRLALQEQNARPGLVTRIAARWAAQVHLGFERARDRIPAGARTEIHAHGNPVPPPGADSGSPGFDWPEGRVLLVVGGSQGAAGLNERMLDDLRSVRVWPADLHLVWIAGRRHAEEVAREAERSAWSEQIRVVSYIEGLGGQLDRVSLAVSRAGAMFVAELAAAGVPAVLVPFPAAAGGHQRANARAMEAAGAAVVREEEGLGRGELWRTASEILADAGRRARLSGAARELGSPDAAARIAADLLRLVGGGDGDEG